MTKPTKTVICCGGCVEETGVACGNCGVAVEVELTDAEIAALEAQRIAYEAQKAAEEAEAKRIADLKASAKAKLIAGKPLTAEEADTLVI